jgi:DNA-binding MarR family transcriptional regulator
MVKLLDLMATESNKRRAALLTRLERRKQGSVGQLLMRAGRLYQQQAMARVQARVASAKPAHTALLEHIDLGGTRLTEIARRAGVSKQAVGQLVDELEAQGIVVRQPDPDDARAQRVMFTDDGLEQLVVGIDVLDELELELGGDAGAMTLDRLRRDLQKLLPALEKKQQE